MAATLKMVVEKKKFEKRSKIPPLENPFRTGHFLDVVAYPEISESGNFFESSFYDITHAVTKFRGHASGQEKPGIMGGFRECWEYVASEGKTPLTLSILKDRPDMMSYNLAKLLFCREVERRMRSLVFEHHDMEMRTKFLSTAEACEWVGTYTMAFMEPGISAKARTR